MWGWIVYLLPWWVKLGFWVIIALAIVVLVLRLFGFKWGAIVTAILGVAIFAASLFNKGQQQGYEVRKAEEVKSDQAAVKDFNEVHNVDAQKSDADSIAPMLAGCSLTPAVESSNPFAIWCATSAPEIPSASQYAGLSHKQKVDMLDHNSFGVRHCGWKPPH